MRVVTIVGARPQFVKAAVVGRQMRIGGAIQEILVHTGQHYDAQMSSNIFADLELPAAQYSLDIGSGSHGEMTGRMLTRIEQVLQAERPDYAVVYGDTNSTLAGALAAAKLHIPVAHVEAGLRSFNRRMPEEVNRVIADHISNLHFAPTETAVQNLAREGVSGESVMLVGDVMCDAIEFYATRALELSRVFDTHALPREGFVLVTIHRAENTDDQGRLRTICAALRMVARHVPVVWPLHPRTRAALDRDDLLGTLSGVHVTPPVGYLDMIALQSAAQVVATDSGGVQKEAYLLGTPCITLRDETEWVELVAVGANRLVAPVAAEAIVDAILGHHTFPPNAKGLYGDGRAGLKICEGLLHAR